MAGDFVAGRSVIYAAIHHVSQPIFVVVFCRSAVYRAGSSQKGRETQLPAYIICIDVQDMDTEQQAWHLLLLYCTRVCAPFLFIFRSTSRRCVDHV